MSTWVPRSQRLGKHDYDGPFEGVPGHLMPQVLKWIEETVGGLQAPREFVLLLALRLRIPLELDYGRPLDQLLTAAGADEDFLWDVVEGVIRVGNPGPRATKELRVLLDLAGSAYTVSDDGLIVERVGDQAQAVYDAATSAADQITEDLRESWSKAYGRSPDPSDAWDHAIKAVETALQPIVLPADGKATLGKIIGELKSNPQRFKSAFAGPDGDNAVDKLVETLRLLWPNPDRHGSGSRTRKPTLPEARAVVNLAAALVQCERTGYLVALR